MGKADHANPLKVLLDPRVLLLSLAYIGLPLAAYGLSYWLPTVVKGFGVSNTVNGFLNIIPWLCTAVALWWLPRHSDRTGKKIGPLVTSIAIAAVCLVLSAVAPGNVAKFVFLCLAAASIFAAQPIFWTLPSRFLHAGHGGGGAGDHQFHRQHGRLHRAERGAHHPRRHRQQPGPDVLPGRVHIVRRGDVLLHRAAAGRGCAETVPGGVAQNCIQSAFLAVPPFDNDR